MNTSCSYAKLLSVLVISLSSQIANGQLQFAEPTISAAEVRAGTILSHRFVFTNQGKEIVEIIEAKATCGCLTSHLEQKIFKPGESGSLLLEVNTLSQPAGPNSWGARVHYRSGGQTYEAVLKIIGRVIREVTVQPAAMTVMVDNAVSHEIVVTDVREKPLSITEVRASSMRLQARLAGREVNATGQPVSKIRVEVAADCAEGRHDDVVQIFTNDPSYAELRVPVTIVKRARPRMVATPNELSFTVIPGQPVASRIVQIRDAKEEQVVVDRVEADDPAIVCKWAQGPNNQVTVKINVKESQGKEPIKSAVHVHISKPVNEVLTIPVRGGQ